MKKRVEGSGERGPEPNLWSGGELTTAAEPGA
jgi:hypothetical protein